MPQPPIEADKALLLIISFGVILLGVAGLLILISYNIWQKRQAANPRREQPVELEAPATPSASSLTLPNASAALNNLGDMLKRPPNTSGPKAQDIMRVWRDPLTGRLGIEVNGQRFTHLSEIPNPAVAQAVQAIIADLQNFASLTHAPVPAPTAPPLPPPVYQPPGLSQPPSVVQPLPVYQSPSAPPEPAVMKPSMNPFTQAKVLREMSKSAPVLKSIPEIIDDFLQQKLMGTPHIWRGLRVKAGPNDVVLFEVDGQSYDSVDAVPDVEIRNLIQGAIKEWDSQR